jgi:hypothetical protein
VGSGISPRKLIPLSAAVPDVTRDGRRRWTAAVVAASVPLVVGLLPEWVHVDPAHTGPVPAIHLVGMNGGVQWLDGILLAAVAVAVGATLAGRQTLGGGAAAAVGAAAVVVGVVYRVMFQPDFGGVFTQTYGPMLTALGGLSLAAVGAVELRRSRRSDDDSATW